ncbi:MAG TPA: hypothetical protein VE620_02345 [Myxococcales bacterium]|jgi:hypothetical protein|nr:hypothetical protein [Myxococcales bacterium]
MIVGVVVGGILGYAIAIAFLWTARRFENAFHRDADRILSAPAPRKAA